MYFSSNKKKQFTKKSKLVYFVVNFLVDLSIFLIYFFMGKIINNKNEKK